MKILKYTGSLNFATVDSFMEKIEVQLVLIKW